MGRREERLPAAGGRGAAGGAVSGPGAVSEPLSGLKKLKKVLFSQT